jgi:hypothetical protein
MKLLKLVSSENLTESTFTNQFSIPLVLKPNSEIALKSLTMEFDSPSFVIDETNNQFSFKTKASAANPTHIVNITNGKYNGITSLLKEIQNKMNNILISKNENIPTDKYFQWRISPQESLSGNLNVFMEYKCSVPDISPVNESSASLDGVNFTAGEFVKTRADDGSYNAVWYGIKPVNKGGFQCSIKVTSPDTNIATADWIWGADRSFITSKLTLKDDIIAGMWFCMANTSTGFYAFKKAGLMVATNIAIAANDILLIYKENGKIQYSITKGTTPATVFEGDIINDVILNLGSEDANMCFHYGQNGAKIKATSVFYTPDPYIDVSANGVYTVIRPIDSVETYYNSNLTATPSNMVCILNFPLVGIRRLLGFSQLEYRNNRIASAFVSDAGGVSVNLVREDLEVEILELELDNFTNTYKQKRNMVMSISTGELRGSVVASGNGKYTLSYSEPANFCFIELGNEYKQQHGQLTMRITSAGQTIQMSGKISALLLYQTAK